MTLHISPLIPEALPALQLLRSAQLAPHPCMPLAQELQDAARGHGKNAALAWRGEQPVGCAGWVTLGIAEDGCAYGSPVFAADLEVAAVLIAFVRKKAMAAGARRLRISTRVGESAKLAGLRQAGFIPLFEFVNFARMLPFTGTMALPVGLHRVGAGAIDWGKLHQCHADTFSGVPNSPIPDEATLREQWEAADMRASPIVVDDAGEYQAFALVTDSAVDAVGVLKKRRVKGLAATLYHLAAIELAAQGKTEMSALVAATNAASMRLHQKLGFTEAAPRWMVHELSW